jgi:hypothetical protein
MELKNNRQPTDAPFLAVFARLRVALACGGGSGGRCGWKLRSREAGSALAHAGKARRQAKPPPAGLPKGASQSVSTFS